MTKIHWPFTSKSINNILLQVFHNILLQVFRSYNLIIWRDETSWNYRRFFFNNQDLKIYIQNYLIFQKIYLIITFGDILHIDVILRGVFFFFYNFFFINYLQIYLWFCYYLWIYLRIYLWNILKKLSAGKFANNSKTAGKSIVIEKKNIYRRCHVEWCIHVKHH